MKYFMVNVELNTLDEKGVENGTITTTHVPTIAKDSLSAKACAVVWQSDGGIATIDNQRPEDFVCIEKERGYSWVVTRCIEVTKEEFDIFCSITHGISENRYCKQED